MVWVISILIIICLIISVIWLSKLTVDIYFTYAEEQKDLIFTVSWFGMRIFKRIIPLIELNLEEGALEVLEKDDPLAVEGREKRKKFTLQDMKNQLEDVNKLIRTTTDFFPQVKRILSTFEIRNLECSSSIGLGRADHTAILIGQIYSIQAVIYQILASNIKKASTPLFQNHAVYSREYFEIDFNCILSFKIGDIMRSAFKIMKQYQKVKKVGFE
ncbi:hypothetical protein CEY16_05990 [Halalkalibacillus sediminis]|uniref:DUF2953 domain-containing protein n=1 Tax=Halalkalibacillus sediminis TaxID=2018042 RepID=A0A2I0QY98_9BACI|nr:hypothetical protein [Halalkalibacillus sediminis]PKR79289.1 hypothetical protein CEY16_05990 [Halalkalibacillus sediminis]